MKKILSLIILFVMIVIIGGRIMFYIESNRIYKQIKNGETIDTKLGNATTAPMFLKGFFNFIDSDKPHILLVEACYYSNYQAAEMLLKNGANPNYTLKGRFSPIEATVYGHVIDQKTFDMIKLLTENGANVDLYSSDEPIIMFLSATSGEDPLREEIVFYLLEHGATPVDDQGKSVLRSAIYGNGNVNFVKRLLENYHLDVNEVSYQGQTPLIACSYYKKSIGYAVNLDMVKMLLDHGADKTIKDIHGKTAYDYAVENGYTDVAELLK